MSDDMADASSRVGQVLSDKWTLERLLGVGGMAAVYAARHRNGARAALKILHKELANNEAVRERFLREGYAANRVEHPGAVRVLDDDIVKDGPDSGAAYIVMELLDGESLEERAGRGPLSEPEYLWIADGVLAVLEAAHEHGVVHRDLKPPNIFLAQDGDGKQTVKLLDFGLARLSENRVQTQFGVALGTPSYMSPEQAAGRTDDIDGRTDIFSLGATGFRLLTGRRIHEAENMQLLIAMANEPAPRVRSVAPRISERVAAIIDRAIAFRREDRYQTAAAMRADIKAALEEPVARPSDSSALRAAPPRRSWTLPLVGATVVTAGFIGYAVHNAHFEDADPEADASERAGDGGVDAAPARAASSTPKSGASTPKKNRAPAPPSHKTR